MHPCLMHSIFLGIAARDAHSASAVDSVTRFCLFGSKQIADPQHFTLPSGTNRLGKLTFRWPYG